MCKDESLESEKPSYQSYWKRFQDALDTTPDSDRYKKLHRLAGDLKCSKANISYTTGDKKIEEIGTIEPIGIKKEEPILIGRIQSALALMRDNEIFKASERSLKAAEESAKSAKTCAVAAKISIILAAIALIISIA